MGRPRRSAQQCETPIQRYGPTYAALIADLKQKGMLEDTLVVWGGEFGRTVYCQGKLTRQNYGETTIPTALLTGLLAEV